MVELLAVEVDDLQLGLLPWNIWVDVVKLVGLMRIWSHFIIV